MYPQLNLLTAVTAIITDSVSKAAEILMSGGLVAFPTETVYGLGADATNSDAVAGIFESKQRPRFDPLIVHIADPNQLYSVVSEFPPTAQRLAQAFWPGPLTLVLPRSSAIPDLVTAGLPGVGVRIPAHPLALQLLRAVRRPVAAPSANPFGRISPTTAEHVRAGLGRRIDGILDGGPCQVGVESTVISLMEEQPVLLRYGGCPVERIEQIAGPVRIARPDPAADQAAQPAPGMLSRHYAPEIKLLLIDREQPAEPIPGLRCGLLTEGTRTRGAGFERIEILSDTGDLRSCAASFFAALRNLDSADLDVIIAHRFLDTDLGVALNDRLQRAAMGSGG